MLLSTTLRYLLHHSTSSLQRGLKSKAMFFYDDPACMIWDCKIQFSTVIFWHYWENGLFEQNFSHCTNTIYT